MNIILIGTGRMGRLLKECALDAGDAVVGEYGRANIAELAAAPAASSGAPTTRSASPCSHARFAS